MANYNTLKTSIQDVIRTNGNNEITGILLQQSLLAMLNSLGAGYQYMGVATPTTNPGTPDQRVFYFANQVGEYSNFGFTLQNVEVAIFKWDGTWHKDSIFGVDYIPKSLLINAFNTSDVQNGYINQQGNIEILASGANKVVKFYLTSGTYRIKSPGTVGYFVSLVKYTTDTYGTVDKIIKAHGAGYDDIIELESGYYAYAWNEGADYDAESNFVSRIDNFLSTNVAEEDNKFITSGAVKKAITNYISGKKTVTTGLQNDANSVIPNILIPVVPGESFVVIGTPTTNSAYQYFDEDGEYIGYATITGGQVGYTNVASETTHFIRVSFDISKLSEAKIISLKRGIIWQPVNIDIDNKHNIDTTFIHKNYIDNVSLTNTGYFVLNANAIVTNDFIPVTPGDAIKWNNNSTTGNLCFYAANKTFVTYRNATTYTSWTVPANCAFVKVAFLKQGTDKHIYINDKLVWQPVDNIPGDIITLFREISSINENLFVSNYKSGKKLSITGAETDDTGAILMNDYIPANPNAAYTFVKCTGYICAFSQDKTLLQYWSTQVPDNTRTITTPANTAFVRCAFLKESTVTAQILDKDKRIIWAAFNTEIINSEITNVSKSLISDYDKMGDVVEFYREYIRQKAAIIYGRDVLYGQNGDSFIFLTDYHEPDIGASAVTNFRHSPALVRYIQKNTNTRLFIFGGDTVCSPLLADRENRMQLFLSDFKDTNMFPMMGNHEWRNAYVEDAPERNKRDFGSFLKPLKGITFNRTTKMPYYYFDNEETKVRYFMLYAVENSDIRSLNFVSEQLVFLETHFRELDSTWKVVVCQHIVFISAEFDDDDNIIDAVFGGLGNNIKTKLDELSEINNAPKILCVISGHTHFDWLEFSNKGYPLISTCCDATYDKHNIPYPNNDTRLKDTTSEQAFDVVHFDFVGNYMYMERVGWGKNRLADLTPKNLQLGQTLTIISKLSGTLNWWSSDTAILTVNNGVVTPVSAGNAFVRVADTNDNYEYVNINVQ